MLRRGIGLVSTKATANAPKRWLSDVTHPTCGKRHLLPKPNPKEIDRKSAEAHAQKVLIERQSSPNPPHKNTIIALSSVTDKQLSNLLKKEFDNLRTQGYQYVEVTIDFTQAPDHSSCVVTAEFIPDTNGLTTNTSQNVTLVADLKNKPLAIVHYGTANKSHQKDNHVKVYVCFDKHFNTWEIVKIQYS